MLRLIGNLNSKLYQLVLEIEADQDDASSPDSLMDRVLVGMITAYRASIVQVFLSF